MSLDAERLAFPGEPAHEGESLTPAPDVRASCAHGKRLLHLGQFPEAVELFKKAISADPDVAEPYVLMAAAYIYMEQQAQAVESCKQALHLKPTDPYASFYLGFALSKLGQMDEALAAYRFARQYSLN